MAFYRYTATEISTGKRLDGTIQAKSDSEAIRTLQSRGYRHVDLASQSSSSADGGLVRTRRASEYHLSLFFAQAASLLKSGISPHEAFQQLSGRVQNGGLKRAAIDVSLESREGGAVSAALAKYVDLFPHNAVGMVRAGEMGGFLPEALNYLASQYGDQASMKRWFWWVRAATWQALLALTFGLPVPFAFWAGFHAGTSDGFISSYLKFLLFPTLPIAIGIGAAALLLRFVLLSPSKTRFRHRLALRLPFGLGERGRFESYRAFLWTLRSLSNAGISPNSAWNLASGAVPNAELALQLAESGRGEDSRHPFSTRMMATGVLPSEFDAVMLTAEQSGDVVGALDSMVNVASEEMNVAKERSRAGVVSMGCLILLIAGGALGLFIASQYYGRVFEQVDRFMESP